MKIKYNSRLILNCALVLLVMFLPSIVMAQPGDGGDNPDVPIDGGLGLLLAAGVGYGVKKYRDNLKKEAQETEK